MNKKNINESVESRVCFEQLEDWVRERIQGWVQGVAGGGSEGAVRAGQE